MILLLFTVSISNAQFEIKNELDGLLFPFSTVTAGFGNYLTSDSNPLSENQLLNLDVGEINFIDKSAVGYNKSSATLSDILISLQVASTGLFSFSGIEQDQLNVMAVMYYQTMTLNYGLNTSMKRIFMRKRPYVYHDEAPQEEKLTKDAAYSFYSGHSSTAFASAVFNSIMINEYVKGEWKSVGIGLNLLNASIIAYLRVDAGKHFPTDVLTGAVVGSAIAFFISEIHKADENKIPINNQISSGIYRFNFSLPF